MIECILTVDYEIYGNGKGTLAELVYEPAQRLKALFDQFGCRFVLFAEAAELEMIEAAGTDSDIGAVQGQIRSFHNGGFEIGLHFHPWWYNAKHHNGEWELDYAEYNTSALTPDRVSHMIDRSIGFLRTTLRDLDFTPSSFRAGHLLYQPGSDITKALALRGVRLDSSVYKGGVWRQHNLDYRPAARNGNYWRISHDSNTPDPCGPVVEVPIYTEMVPIWRMFTSKRVGLERKAGSASRAGRKIMTRLRDASLYYPLKFDFCSMSIDEMTRIIDAVLREDREDPGSFRPLVAIGHTKDLVDLKAVELLLEYLYQHEIPVSTFTDVLGKGLLGASPLESMAS